MAAADVAGTPHGGAGAAPPPGTAVTAAELAWLARARAARVGRLGTRNAEGGIDLVPFVFAGLDGPGPLGRLVSAVDHKPKRHGALRRLDNVAAYPSLTVLVDHYDEDWDQLWWARLRGVGRRVDEGPEREASLDTLQAKYAQYRERRPAGAVLVVEVVEVTGWSATAPPP